MTHQLEELSVRARRGELNEAEERQLRLLLASSLEAQLAHRAGCDFDVEDSVLPGDDALAGRVSQRLIRELQPAAGRRPRLRWRFVAAAVVTVAAAAAGPLVVARQQQASGASSSCAASGSGAQAEPAPPAGSVLALPPRQKDPPPTPSQTSSGDAMPARSVAPAANRPMVPHGGPAALFAEASRARREGRTDRALVLYETLQSRHPTSAEARAADLALGMLYAGHSPQMALTYFRRYRNHGGPLLPEALWGEAQALSALGRSDEARAIYRTLLANYPRSAYASAARAKLDAE